MRPSKRGPISWISRSPEIMQHLQVRASEEIADISSPDRVWGEQRLPWIEANGVSIHYKLEGTADQTVILLHEIGGSPELMGRHRPGPCQKAEGLPLRPARLRLVRKSARALQHRDAGRRSAGTDRGARSEAAVSYRCRCGLQHAGAEFQARNRSGVASLVFCNPYRRRSGAGGRARECRRAGGEGRIRGVLPLMLDKSYPPTLSDARNL